MAGSAADRPRAVCRTRIVVNITAQATIEAASQMMFPVTALIDTTPIPTASIPFIHILPTHRPSATRSESDKDETNLGGSDAKSKQVVNAASRHAVGSSPPASNIPATARQVTIPTAPETTVISRPASA